MVDTAPKQNSNCGRGNKGPRFCDEEGYVWDSVTINEMLHEVLEFVYAVKKDLFPFGVQTADDVRLKYGIY